VGATTQSQNSLFIQEAKHRSLDEAKENVYNAKEFVYILAATEAHVYTAAPPQLQGSCQDRMVQ